MLKVLRALEQESVGINHLRRALTHMGLNKKVRVTLYDDLGSGDQFGKYTALIVLYMLHGKKEDKPAAAEKDWAEICLSKVTHGQTLRWEVGQTAAERCSVYHCNTIINPLQPTAALGEGRSLQL